ncbi:hypothetical protein [Burkholderia sp. WSM2232]|uniref:hypothetical protein n=1 Tax=Burkholderia sp. WSM2232 TaxID=944436 RepID=UPI0018DCF450|nr:hypothetical protein [Burkholderia sp. WSM2232]
MIALLRKRLCRAKERQLERLPFFLAAFYAAFLLSLSYRPFLLPAAARFFARKAAM